MPEAPQAFQARLPRALYERLRSQAFRKHWSMNTIVVWCVEVGLEAIEHAQIEVTQDPGLDT